MLATIGVNLEDTYRANVFSRQPSGNNLHLYGTSDPTQQWRELGPLAASPLAFLDVRHLGELERVHAEIAECNPNIIIALGNTATWALGLGLGINALRGSVHTTTISGLPRPVKVLPTFHPAAVLRQWDTRVICLADLAKAERESHSPDFNFDNTELWLMPTLEDLEEFDERFMRDATVCACDIETKRGQIDAVCFTPTPEVSLSIPFWINGPNPNYWPSPEDEVKAWSYAIRWMEDPNLTKIFQNGLFDLQYLMSFCTPRACTEDTMLQSHSLFSEMKKGLGFLGSIHANYPSWKQLIKVSPTAKLKRDD